MRRMILLTTLFALACSGPGSQEPSSESPGDWVAEVRSTENLSGLKVEETATGPWTIRRTESPPRARGRWAAGGDIEADGAMLAEGVAAEPMARADDGPATGGARPSPVMDPKSAEPPDAHNASASPLRAGSTDDNEDLDAFLTFLATWGDREGAPGNYQLIDVADRRYVRVVNSAGRPIPAARVKIVDEAADRVLLVGTTYGDGRVPFYPHATRSFDPTVAVSYAPNQKLIVEASFGNSRQTTRWDGADEELVMTLNAPRPVTDPLRLDVLLLIDTTGSMSDEIDRIKASLLGVTAKLRSLEREFDLRYSAVLYRDIGDAYVTKAHPFTGDMEAFDAALRGIRADGGGDGPESVNQGLAEAVGRSDWRDGAAKVMFLVADAPPHMDYQGDTPYGTSLQAAVAGGIRVHTVAASGLDGYEAGSLVFRQIAQFTRGKFIFIEYGTIDRSAAAHGVEGKVKSNNLDDILFEQIRDEIAMWGR